MTNGNNHAQQVVQKLWNYCDVLRDDGLSYGDYLEQLTYFLFLKMAHERTGPPWRSASVVPAGLDWRDVHTLLRLPTGIFYAQGVKANVLFFDRKPGREEPWTDKLWIYDLRSNLHFTLRTNPLRREDLDDFVACYKPDNRYERAPTWSEENPPGRWRAFAYDELVQRDKASLDLFWLRDESLEDAANLPEPDEIAAEIIEDLRPALEQLEAIQGI